MMDKPSTLLHREFKTAIVTAINTSGLPAFAIAPVLEDALREVRAIEEQQYQEDKKNYEATLNQED